FAAVGERPAGLIRVAVPLKRVEERIALAESQWFGILALGTVLALLLAFALSARLERSLKEMIRVVEGIAAAPAVSEEVEAGVSHPEQAPVVLNRRRLHIVPGREFRRLARAVNDMADRIEDDLRTIAEHKAQLETILDSMDEGVLVIGAAGRIRLVNPALVRFFPQTVHAVGRLPVEVLPIAELQQALDELLARPLSCSLEGAVQDRLVSTLEVEPTHDTVFSVHLIRPRCAVNGVLAVAVFHDVSETARLLRVRREFVANVSHELRTPLTAITGYAETLRDTPPEDAATCVRFAEIILRHARLMGSMVEDLLNLSRLESGAVPLSPVPLRASVVVAEVANACQPLFVARKLSLVVAVDTTVMIRADSHFIAQVFRNLLENACRYAPEGTAITVTGKTHPGAHDEGEALVVFTVKDEGPGIPSSALTRVFERFYRVEKHRGGAGGGSTGLGLAICKHIVERHNGRIWADAGPCGVFHFTVPSC
ncbi:MAG: ATP-binding protein, partial [Bilophila sp.]